ncbi:protein RD3-like [Anguilla rostrata]|uniref:protein RD3-like n=1 Tax=Anguilla anguilla TaxID=7936 RepID=UPI0015B10999|nr:protein RD3-like [Anguilla anguilla]
MPLFGWMKRPRGEGVSAEPGGPSRTLMRELLWHVEERERLAREVELQHRLSHGTLGYRWTRSYPSLRALIPPSERQQLEHLCAQIEPVHTAAVLCRFREVLARNNILPWELVYVFKQVLKDFLGKEEDEEEERRLLRPMEAWTNRYHMKQGFVTPTVPDCGETHKEEIPTISSYVDRSMRRGCPYLTQRDWDLPYYYPTPYNCSEAYSTML